jgi:hypothetical protein
MRAVVALSIGGVIAATVVLFLVVRVASQRPGNANLGDKVFEVGDAKRLAKLIQDDHEPFLFKDPLTSRPGREVYVQHLGDDYRKGWLAIEAYAPDAPRELRCILTWDRSRDLFVDPCGAQGFPADGAGLRIYPAAVNERDRLVVDLRTNPVP